MCLSRNGALNRVMQQTLPFAFGEGSGTSGMLAGREFAGIALNSAMIRIRVAARSALWWHVMFTPAVNPVPLHLAGPRGLSSPGDRIGSSFIMKV
jgi:hypothetical protein